MAVSDREYEGLVLVVRELTASTERRFEQVDRRLGSVEGFMSAEQGARRQTAHTHSRIVLVVACLGVAANVIIPVLLR